MAERDKRRQLAQGVMVERRGWEERKGRNSYGEKGRLERMTIVEYGRRIRKKKRKRKPGPYAIFLKSSLEIFAKGQKLKNNLNRVISAASFISFVIM